MTLATSVLVAGLAVAILIALVIAWRRRPNRALEAALRREGDRLRRRHAARLPEPPGLAPNPRQRRVAALCEEGIRRIDAAIAVSPPEAHSQHSFEPPADLLRKVREELVRMREALDPLVYDPGYARPLDDCWDGDLVDFLTTVEYEYGRIRKKGRLRQERSDL